MYFFSAVSKRITNVLCQCCQYESSWSTVIRGGERRPRQLGLGGRHEDQEGSDRAMKCIERESNNVLVELRGKSTDCDVELKEVP